MKDFDGASGLLLINIDFIRAVIKFDALDVGLKDKAIYFLVIYAFSILNLLLGFFLRMSYWFCRLVWFVDINVASAFDDSTYLMLAVRKSNVEIIKY